MTHPGLRASDDDRQRAVTALERHTAEGRLTLDEYSERVSQVYRAATHGDLARITHDLPAMAPLPEPPRSDQRQVLIAFLLAAVTIALIGIAVALWKP